MKKILIGTGVLTWNRSERVSNRYGSIYLGVQDSELSTVTHKLTETKIDIIEKLVGKAGKLIAVAIETRQSTHIGDLFRGISPSTPDVGEVIELGDGFLFTEPNPYEENCHMIGVKPLEEREDDWMNPNALYRAHEQTVELYFEPRFDDN